MQESDLFAGSSLQPKGNGTTGGELGKCDRSPVPDNPVKEQLLVPSTICTGTSEQILKLDTIIVLYPRSCGCCSLGL